MRGNGSPIIGRAEEITALAELQETDRPVAVVGEAGVGKTTLVRAAVRQLGRPLWQGGAFATLSWSRYLPIEQALGTSSLQGDPAFVARTTAQAVGDGVLFIDDLQWADAGTREVVATLVGRVGLIVAVRTGDPGSSELVESLREAGLAVLALEPLLLRDAAAVVRRSRPDLPAAVAQRLARRSGGNPLLAEELARSGGGASSTLSSLIRLRLQAFDEGAREALAIVALAARPLPAAAIGHEADGLAAGGLIVQHDDAVEVRHGLIGEAVVNGVDPDRRRDLHARLARLVEHPAEAARHHAAAGERALACSRALEAAALAATPGERATHLEVAATVADGDEATTLTLEAAQALLDAGTAAAALKLLSADISWGSYGARRARLRAAALRRVGPADAAEAAIDEGLALSTDPVDEALLRIEAARVAYARPDPPPRVLALSEIALDHAERTGVGEIPALAARGNARYANREPGWEADLTSALASARQAADLDTELLVMQSLVFDYLKEGRAEDGRRLALEISARSRELHLRGWEASGAGWAIGFAWHLGRFIDAVEAAQAFEAEFEESEDFYHAQVLVDIGRFDEAAIRAERFLDAALPGEFGRAEALWLAADVALLSGRAADALDAVEMHRREYPMAGHRPFVMVVGAWAATDLGRPEDWPPLPEDLPIVAGARIELEGIRALVDGDGRTAAALFDEAADAWAGRHVRGELRSRWAAGESLRRAGLVPAARDRLLELETRLEASRAHGHLGRVRRSLRLCGVRRTVRSASVPGSPLTERERKILELVGNGFRTAEIAARLGVSRWAVTRAIGSATAKLGASTTAEALVAAAS